ncbi:MAG: STAS domain-containing protein [Ignavibacteria bacterium]|nr:STAS domain-containing protein [Ignavibacteria bacterium]
MSDTINFELKKNNGVVVMKLNEPRVDSSVAGLLKGEFSIILTDEEIRYLVLDLSPVEYCDSSGLSAILLAYRLLQSNEGNIKLASPQKNVKSLIEISQLDRVLPIYNSVDEALADVKN